MYTSLSNLSGQIIDQVDLGDDAGDGAILDDDGHLALADDLAQRFQGRVSRHGHTVG
jgi:hypothetical protein